MQYEKDVIYSLKVTGTMITNDCHYYLIENEGIKYKVKMLKFQHKLPVPDEVKCIVYSYDADDTPLFAQHKGEISRKLYTVGSTYPFVVQQKPGYQSGHRNIYYGYDMNGIRALIQVRIDYRKKCPLHGQAYQSGWSLGRRSCQPGNGL